MWFEYSDAPQLTEEFTIGLILKGVREDVCVNAISSPIGMSLGLVVCCAILALMWFGVAGVLNIGPRIARHSCRARIETNWAHVYYNADDASKLDLLF